MSALETLLTYPLAPSELAALNGAAFAPPAGLADRQRLLNSDLVVSASALTRALIGVAFLAAEQAGGLRLAAGPRRTAFGPTRTMTVYVEPGGMAPAWPAGCLEAQLPALAARLSASGAHEAGNLVHAWLGADSANPWQKTLDQVYAGLAGRGLLDQVEAAQFGFVKTRIYQAPPATVALAQTGPVAAVQAFLRDDEAGRPELWARLGEQIDGGVRRRLAAVSRPAARPADEDD